MTPLELAQKYMDIVFNTGDLGQLRTILARDLQFSGPFYSFDSADSYIASMLANPPEGFDFEVIQFYEDETSACLIYNFTKSGISTPMTQLFETDKDRITSILLVFDTRAFDSGPSGNE
ncbi:MAG: nuclear transport factor 2 family protein [Reichenbachiella sp.]|uniref:nuclear transport factor 2 family protein n=1 Tax=Reichenbachiella sp. TaxID=2184521 RepID=UPI00326791FD